MVKLLLGLVKGSLIGGAVGYGAWAIGADGGLLWLVYGAIGALVGLLVGRPLWSLITDKAATSWVAVLKSVVGFGVACGIYALVDRVWGGFAVEASFLGEGARPFQHWPPLFGAALGALYGAFVELDDSLDDDRGGAKPAPGGARPPAAKGAGGAGKPRAE